MVSVKDLSLILSIDEEGEGVMEEGKEKERKRREGKGMKKRRERGRRREKKKKIRKTMVRKLVPGLLGDGGIAHCQEACRSTGCNNSNT